MKPARRILVPVLAALVISALPMRAAAPADTPDGAQIALALKKLTVVGRALYVAAHPDDENTAFLAWLSRDRLVDTGYLSLTRGDGGQNLIGSDTAELLGVIRTQELLAARRIDGARQFFTRAIDFGYSKSPEETLRIWGKEQVLADVVWVIRIFRPDVIVTRFPTTGEGGHGNHTASALLAVEAFTAAADPARFPEQLRFVKPWQAKRILWNVFRFGADAPRQDVPGQVSVDLGGYNALLGKSYTEIAALSRSMHKSQGFGSAERRGTFLNDFKTIGGDAPTSDLFDGIDLTWLRFGKEKEKENEETGRLLRKVEEGFRPEDPAASVPGLVAAWTSIGRAGGAASGTPNSPFRRNSETSSREGDPQRSGPQQIDPLLFDKRAEIAEAIRSCLGLWIEAIASDETATPGSELKVATMILNRSALPLTVQKIEVTHQTSEAAGGALKRNEPLRGPVTVKLPPDMPSSNPYWLSKKPSVGLFTVDDPSLIGRPESPPSLTAKFTVLIDGTPLEFETPVVFRRTDPVKGEEYRPFNVVPPVTANFDEKVYAFADGKPKAVRVTLKGFAANAAGTVRLKMPPGFVASPAEAPFQLKDKGEERSVAFTVTPPGSPAAATMTAEMSVGGAAISSSLVRIDYPHIPVQMLFPPAEARVVRLDLKAPKRNVGYVMGPGDGVPEALRQVGYPVTLLSDDELESGDLSRYGTIVTGVRAFNTRGRLKHAAERLLEWVKAGGTLVEQYNTSQELVTERLGPYPFKLSRDRVTVEEAPVTFVAPAHPLLNTPNKITAADFDGWVQERGLYFAGTWDPQYETVIACHDPNEPDKPGGLLFARYGKGAFVYTGYAFFRQLPAGVPGAYRLFANLVSAGTASK